MRIEAPRAQYLLAGVVKAHFQGRGGNGTLGAMAQADAKNDSVIDAWVGVQIPRHDLDGLVEVNAGVQLWRQAEKTAGQRAGPMPGNANLDEQGKNKQSAQSRPQKVLCALNPTGPGRVVIGVFGKNVGFR